MEEPDPEESDCQNYPSTEEFAGSPKENFSEKKELGMVLRPFTKKRGGSSLPMPAEVTKPVQGMMEQGGSKRAHPARGQALHWLPDQRAPASPQRSGTPARENPMGYLSGRGNRPARPRKTPKLVRMLALLLHELMNSRYLKFIWDGIRDELAPHNIQKRPNEGQRAIVPLVSDSQANVYSEPRSSMEPGLAPHHVKKNKQWAE